MHAPQINLDNSDNFTVVKYDKNYLADVVNLWKERFAGLISRGVEEFKKLKVSYVEIVCTHSPFI